MKFIFKLMFFLLMSNGLYAYSMTSGVQPIPAPTSPLWVMEIEGNDSISSKRVKNQLKDLANQVKQNKDVYVYIISYGRSTHPREALRRANQIKSYLVKNHKVESDRIVTVDAGNEKSLRINIYLVPSAGEKHNPSSLLDKSEVWNCRAKQKKQNALLKSRLRLTNHFARGSPQTFIYFS